MIFAWGGSIGTAKSPSRSRAPRPAGRGALVRATLTAVAAAAWVGRASAVSLLLSANPAQLSGPAAPLLSAAVRVGQSSSPLPVPGHAVPRAELWQLPLAFEPAGDRSPAGADHLARGPGYTVFLGRGGALLALSASENSPTDGSVAAPVDNPASQRTHRPVGNVSYQLVRLRFEGAQDGPPVQPEAALPGRVHRLIGQDPARWQTGLQPHARLRYPEVYPGVDVAFYGRGRELEYDFIIAPGASPGVARLRYDGVRAVEIDDAGELRLDTGRGVLVQRRPIAYQDGPGGREPVSARYVAHADGTIGFEVDHHDPARTLIIDPVLSYATFLGGTGFDQSWDVAVDAAGAAYITGETDSERFTGLSIIGTNAFLGNYQGGLRGVGGDAFVCKLAPDGSTFEWFTYLGGSDLEAAFTIALATGDQPVVGGFTTSTNFPVTPGALAGIPGGLTNRFSNRLPLAGFVTRLTADGSGLVASTLLSGEGEDEILDLAVLGDGSIAVVGSTSSTNFPVSANAAQKTYGGAVDGFLAIVSADATTLLQSTFLGGNSRDTAEGVVATPGTGLIHVSGITFSTNFPVLASVQSTNGGLADAFASGLLAADGSLQYATYLGGASTDYAYRMAANAAGEVLIVGETSSLNFPVTAGAPQPTNAGASDGFVLRLGVDGRSLPFSTYLGGALVDTLWDVAVDVTGIAHLAGESLSPSLTGISTNSLQSTNAGNADVLVAWLDPLGGVTSTFYGSGGDELPFGVAADGAGNTYLVGRARSQTFPVSSTNVAQPTYGGGTADGFAFKLANPPVLAALLTSGGVEVSWAAPNSGFALESAAAAASTEDGDAWQAETGATPVLRNGRHRVQLPMSATNQVFRLRWTR